MKLVRVATAEGAEPGMLIDGVVYRLEGDPMTEASPGAPLGNWDGLEHLAPCRPSKVIGIGRNYAAHVRETRREIPTEPFAFIKTPNTVVGDGAHVRRPVGVERFEFEGELAMVIGRTASRVTAADALDYVLGFTCSNDFTVRDWQVETRQWVLAKSSDTLCPLGPWIATDVGDAQNLALRTYVNGELRQDGRTDDLIFGLGELIEYLTVTATLEPGDVVLTGTPSGAGPVKDGDEVEVDIEGIGSLINRVVDA